MDKAELNKIINKTIQLQEMLFERLGTEVRKVDREWTAMQIAYQKGIYKAAMYAKSGCCVVDGVKMATKQELNNYFLHLID